MIFYSFIQLHSVCVEMNKTQLQIVLLEIQNLNLRYFRETFNTSCIICMCEADDFATAYNFLGEVT